MIELAAVYGDPVVGAVEIDFISHTVDLSVVTESFDVIFSSHCIEHRRIENIAAAGYRYAASFAWHPGVFPVLERA